MKMLKSGNIIEITLFSGEKRNKLSEIVNWLNIIDKNKSPRRTRDNRNRFNKAYNELKASLHNNEGDCKKSNSSLLYV